MNVSTWDEAIVADHHPFSLALGMLEVLLTKVLRKAHQVAVGKRQGSSVATMTVLLHHLHQMHDQT